VTSYLVAYGPLRTKSNFRKLLPALSAPWRLARDVGCDANGTSAANAAGKLVTESGEQGAESEGPTAEVGIDISAGTRPGSSAIDSVRLASSTEWVSVDQNDEWSFVDVERDAACRAHGLRRMASDRGGLERDDRGRCRATGDG